MGKVYFSLFFAAVFFNLTAQSELKIGEWRDFLPFRRGVTVTQNADNIFYGSDNGLITIAKEDMSVDFFSKIEGLSDVAITQIKYQQSRDVLIVCYTNSNIDLIFDIETVNMDGILRNSTILGGKDIHQIFTDAGRHVYLSCEFGLVEVDLDTRKFGFTLLTPSPVRNFCKHNEAFYLATDSGMYLFDDFGNTLIEDINNWEKLGTDQGLPEDYTSSVVVSNGDMLYAGINGEIYANDGEFFLFHSEGEYQLHYLTFQGPIMIAGFRRPAQLGKVVFFDENGVLGEHGFGCVGTPSFAVRDETGRIFYADNSSGVRYAESWQHGCETFEFNTPYSQNVSEMAVRDNVLFVAAGGVTDSYGYLFRQDGYFIYRDGLWESVNVFNNSFMADHDIRDCFRILPHPTQERLFVGSYLNGLLVVDGETMTLYDKDNSALQGTVGDEQRTRVAGLALDENGDLWISNYLAPEPIVVMEADGTWHSFGVPNSTQLAQIAIDERGYKWIMLHGQSQGLLVFDDNGTLDETSDDRYAVYNTSNSALPTNNVLCLEVDLEGDIWVGTALGPVIFDGFADPFDGSSQGFRIKIEQDELISYLLGEEEIQTIAVDGANRKWFGTKHGIFVHSPDGETEIARFQTNNSPLLSNEIVDITFNPFNGEVFIGTVEGIVSMRTDAISGERMHGSSVYAYPNPVREDYQGPIAIRGLPRDAVVKITDLSGRLVFETRALGGQAIWYGKDLSGNPAHSGVYLVFSTNEDTFNKPDAIVTKILLIR